MTERRGYSNSASAPTRLTYYVKSAEVVQRSLSEPRLNALGISFNQLALLRHIGRTPGATTADVARWSGITAQSTGEIVSTLVRRGWIERSDNPNGRRVGLFVTEAGDAMIDSVEGVLDDVNRILTDGIAPEAIEQAISVLDMIITRHQLMPDP